MPAITSTKLLPIDDTRLEEGEAQQLMQVCFYFFNFY